MISIIAKNEYYFIPKIFALNEKNILYLEKMAVIKVVRKWLLFIIE